MESKMRTLAAPSLRFNQRMQLVSIFLFSLLFQLVIIGEYLDNSIISPYVPSAADAADYATRAQSWRSDGFNKAFGDAYRMPGYPFVILTMQVILPTAPYLGVRIIQMLVLAFCAVIIKIVLEKLTSTSASIFGSLLFVILPIWHFVPLLLAECLTAVVVVGLIASLSQVRDNGVSWKQVATISTLLVLGTCLKPNNLLLLIPIATFLVIKANMKSIRKTIGLFLTTLFLLSPWIAFTSNVQPGFLGLTTNTGINLYVGSGMVLSYDKSVLAESAVKWKVDPISNPNDVFQSSPDLSTSQQNTALIEKSMQIWQKRPLNQIGFGLDKALIAFGIRSNSLVDHVFGLFTLLTLLAGTILLKSKEFRPWGFATLATMLTLLLQAIVFQADRRFVVPVLYPFSVICIGLALNFFVSKVPDSLRLNKFRLSLRNDQPDSSSKG
jgi:hypothetical protein